MGLSGRLLFVRDGSSSSSSSSDITTATLLIVLLVLVTISTLCVLSLYYMRRWKRSRSESLPVYEEKSPRPSSSHRRSSARPVQSLYVYREKQDLINNSSSPPSSPLPEIRITFPEEVDTNGKRLSGKVMVVHVGEACVGLEPVSGTLPSYAQSESDRFQSLDLERIGGLREKDFEDRWQ